MTNPGRRLRVVVAKVGLDGHDRGARVIARVLREAGHEVIYLGRRQSPEIVAAVARDEDADIVGISVLSGTHKTIATDVLAALRAADVDSRVVLGGTVLRRDIPELLALGVDAVFPVGSTLQEVRDYFDTLPAQSQ